MSLDTSVHFYVAHIPTTANTTQIVRYERNASNSFYFSLESISQCVNHFVNSFGAETIFTADFFHYWSTFNVKVFTEIECQLIIPPQFLLSIEETEPKLWPRLMLPPNEKIYLNDEYADLIQEYGIFGQPVTDNFCLLLNNDVIGGNGIIKFAHSLSFLSLIRILQPKYVLMMYSMFFKTTYIEEYDIEYIHRVLKETTSIIGRDEITIIEQIVRIIQTNPDLPENVDGNEFERLIRTTTEQIKTIINFHLIFTTTEAQNLLKNLNILRQFGTDNESTLQLYNSIFKINDTTRQNGILRRDALTRQLEADYHEFQLKCSRKLRLVGDSDTILSITKILIKIILAVNDYLNINVSEQQTKFFQEIFNMSPFDSYDEREEIFEILSTPPRKSNKDYKVGEIVLLFLNLDRLSRTSADTLWLTKFLDIVCSSKFNNIIETISDYMLFFKRLFVGPIYESSISNVILYLQGSLAQNKEQVDLLKNIKQHQKMSNFQHKFSITNFKWPIENPLIVFFESMLNDGRKFTNFKQKTKADQIREQMLRISQNKQEEIIQLCINVVAEEKRNDFQGQVNMTDIRGRKYNFNTINYKEIITLPDPKTLSLLNASEDAISLFNEIQSTTYLFSELCNRMLYSVPEVVCKVNSAYK